MSFKFSRCLCLQLPDLDLAVKFYQNVIGLKLISRKGNSAEFKAEQFRFFLDRRASMGPIFEFLVPNVEVAKEQLLKVGCKIVRWKGKEDCCYMREPLVLCSICMRSQKHSKSVRSLRNFEELKYTTFK